MHIRTRLFFTLAFVICCEVDRFGGQLSRFHLYLSLQPCAHVSAGGKQVTFRSAVTNETSPRHGFWSEIRRDSGNVLVVEFRYNAVPPEILHVFRQAARCTPFGVWHDVDGFRTMWLVAYYEPTGGPPPEGFPSLPPPPPGGPAAAPRVWRSTGGGQALDSPCQSEIPTTLL